MLEIIPSSEFSFSSSGLVIPGDSYTNLCVKAYQLLKDDFQFSPVKIHLHKVIPMGAGLGGGSSDGAHALVMLNEVMSLNLSETQLQRYALQLGSDCPFFLRHAPKLGSGRGEILQNVSLSLKGKFIVIIKPDIHVATADAYAGVKPKLPQVDLKDVLENRSVRDWRKFLTNDFEESVFTRYPAIGEIKESLYRAGAVYASMSGSGSSVFGIFENKVDLKERFADHIYWSGVVKH